MSHDLLSDDHDFETPERPTKRLKTATSTNRPGPRSAAIPWKLTGDSDQAVSAINSPSDSDVPVKPARKRKAKITARPRSASNSSGTGSGRGRKTANSKTKRAAQRTRSPASDISEDAFESAPKSKVAARPIKIVESDDDARSKQKKPKHRIYEPADSKLLVDKFITGSQLPPSSDPDSIRGPIWIKRPSPPPPLPTSRTPMRPAAPQPPLFAQQKVAPALTAKLAPKPSHFGNIQQRPQQWPRPDVKPADKVPLVRSTTQHDQLPRKQSLSTLTATTPARHVAIESPSFPTADAGQAPKNTSTYASFDWSSDEDDLANASVPPSVVNQSASNRKPPSFALPNHRINTGNRPSAQVTSRVGPEQHTLPDVSTNRGHAQSAINLVNKSTNNTQAVTAPATSTDLLADELADLPSDAFMSTPEPDSRPAQIPHVHAQTPAVANGMSTGYRQMTLHGSFSDPKDADKTKAKNTIRPIAESHEKPTQHELNDNALSTWVYPVNLGTIRDYQFNIVQIGLFHNLLVALPTGLGKTFIAATVMLNWFRWTKDAQIVFVAPTKPLVAQQVEACFHTVGIPRSETAMLTGNVQPAMRAAAWKEKRVFFTTPQTVQFDLSNGICDPKRIVLLVVDEAHRATGKYAYGQIVQILRRFNQSFRILALTATPGSKMDTVQNVIDNLDIARTEIRTETSLDIRAYVHTRDTETFKFDYSDEQDMIMELFSKALQPHVDKLRSQNATWIVDPRKITAFGLNLASREWAKSEAGRNANQAVKGMIRNCFVVLTSLAQAMTLLKFHGIGPFYRKIVAFRNEVDGASKSKKVAIDIRNSDHFNKMCNHISVWVKNPDFIGHPKLEHLRSVILNHFLDKGETGITNVPSGTRVMVFSQYRDSAEEITRVLKRNEPMIRPRVFVGQAHAEGSTGMDQKTQLEAITQFKEGKFNTLIATSIGEEGLDIGEVDLIICYDANASPIRMLQRMGRTGRKRQGKIVLLLMKEKEDADFAKSKDNYEKMQGLIADGKHFQYHEDRSPRILPKGIRPVVDKRVVEIPVENSQTELPIPRKRAAKAKKPVKKFNMPENVITGFVTASRVRGGGSEVEISGSEEEQARSKSKSKRKPLSKTKSNIPLPPPPEPEGIPLPFLDDVLLNNMQERELVRKYQSVAPGKEAGEIRAPMPEKNLAGFRHLSSTVSVPHSRLAVATAAVLAQISEADTTSVDRLRANLNKSDDVYDPSAADHLYADPNTVDPGEAPPDPDPADDTSDSAALFSHPKPGPARFRGSPKAVKKAAPKPRAAAVPAPKKVPAQRPRAFQRHSSAMEAASSSPAPTPEHMRLPSQGIELGEADTSEDEDAQQGTGEDSELDDFVVGSDEEIEFVSSSLPFIRGDGTPRDKPRAPTSGRGPPGKGPAKGNGKGKANAAVRGKPAPLSGKANDGRGELSAEFVYDSDDSSLGNAMEGLEEDGYDAGFDEGISAGRGRRGRRVIEDSSDE